MAGVMPLQGSWNPKPAGWLRDNSYITCVLSLMGTLLHCLPFLRAVPSILTFLKLFEASLLSLDLFHCGVQEIQGGSNVQAE